MAYSCLENPRDRGAWWAAVYGVAQNRTRLKRLSSSSRGIVRGREIWRAAQSTGSQRVRYDLAIEQQQRSHRPPEPTTHVNSRGSRSSSSWSTSLLPPSLLLPPSSSSLLLPPGLPAPPSDSGLPGGWNPGRPLARRNPAALRHRVHFRLGRRRLPPRLVPDRLPRVPQGCRAALSCPVSSSSRGGQRSSGGWRR